MSYDVKLFNGCDHIVDGVRYDLQLCPKCLGKGYYFDICFDDAGQAILTENDLKLQQEMLKVIIDRKYKNIFHEEWGSRVDELIGSKNNEITKNKLKVIVRQAEEYLQKIQSIEYNEHKNLNNKEILDDIISVNIKELGPTGYLVSVLVKNVAEDIFEQEVLI